MPITDVKSTLPDPYATLAEANILLEGVEIWFEQDDELREEALGWARVYLDSVYTHSFDESDVPNAVKHASAILANTHLSSDLFENLRVTQDPLEETEVEAGPVKTRKRYSARSKWFDPFPNITSLLKDHSRLAPNRVDSPIVRA